MERIEEIEVAKTRQQDNSDNAKYVAIRKEGFERVRNGKCI